MIGEPELTDRQRRVLDAALEVFAERGYAGASTAEIASRARVAEGTVFKRFRTKKDLLLGVLGPYLVDLGAPGVVGAVEEVIADPEADLAGLLRAIARDRLVFARANPLVVRIMLQEVPFHDELRQGVVDALAIRLLPTLRRAMAHFQQRGEIDPDLPPPAAARIIASVLAGYLLARVLVVPEHDWDDEAEINVMVRVLCRGLAPLR